MMAPTVALRDGEVALGLGSAGSNRIRSAILSVAVRVLEQGMDGRRRRAPHPLRGGDASGRARGGRGGVGGGRAAGRPRGPLEPQNLYFGGVQAVAAILAPAR